MGHDRTAWSFYGEFARSMNPPVQSKIYYWIRKDTKDVKLIVRIWKAIFCMKPMAREKKVCIKSPGTSERRLSHPLRDSAPGDQALWSKRELSRSLY